MLKLAGDCFETGADGEEIVDPEDVEDDAFDRANDTVRPEPEPIGSDPRENQRRPIGARSFTGTRASTDTR